MKTTIFATLLVAASFAGAQQHNLKPSDALKGISFLTGDWTGEQNFNTNGGPTMIGKVTAHIHEAVSGHYIEENLTTVIADRSPADVRHFLAFDPKTSTFKAWWFNDTKVGPSMMEGKVTGNKLVLLTPAPKDGAQAGPTLRATYEKPSETTLVYKLEMKVGEGWQELFHTNYTKN